MAYLSPNNQGCWFCSTDDETCDWEFSFEWDSWFHIHCLTKAWSELSQEAEIIVNNEGDSERDPTERARRVEIFLYRVFWAALSTCAIVLGISFLAILPLMSARYLHLSSPRALALMGVWLLFWAMLGVAWIYKVKPEEVQ
jgi:hypothetical protein